MTQPPERENAAAERWRRVEEVLGQALDLDAEARVALLEAECAGDDELRREVEELLAAEAAAPTFLDDSAAGFAADALSEPEPQIPGLESGSTLGEYRLVREIGEGGMSRVFLGERAKGDFEQRVAIKVLRAVGLDAQHGLERFRFERRVLASLDHPHIARIFDGGATGAGLPYLVMEYIEGLAITEYCRRNELGLEARLDLARDVCEAVQYAHQRLIVHRDLKPSNILVAADAQVKLLDFGIAKLLDPDALGSDAVAPLTQTGLLLMTPDYASPEQLLGEGVTTASDVYALGVLLYELLTGQKPYETRGRSAATVERLVCELDPPPPSEVTSRVGPVDWRDRLRGDLDAVVQKALRKEPPERYGSARELGADLERYTKGLPVSAGPTTFGYRARKFVRRNRLPVAAAATLVAALVGFGATMAWQQTQTRKERDRAREAEAEATAINRFLVDDLLGAAAPEVTQGGQITVQEVVERATAQVAGSFAEQPRLEASVRRALGEIHLGLGELDAAAGELARAESLFREKLGEAHPETLDTRRLRAELAMANADFETGLEELRAVRELQRRTLSPADPRVHATEISMAHALIRLGEFDAAVNQLNSTLAVLDETAPDAWRDRLRLLNLLAEAHSGQRRWGEAESIASQALALQLQHLGPNHPDLGATLTTRGAALTKLHRYDEGEEALLKALELRRRLLGPSHPESLRSLRRLTTHFWDRDDPETARIYAEQEYELTRGLYGDDHDRTIRVLGNLGLLYARAGLDDRAAPIYRRLVEVNMASLGPTHPSTMRSLKNLNKFLLRTGKPDEARSVMRRAHEAGWERLETESEDQTHLNDFAFLLTTCRPEELRDPEAALPLAERAVELSNRQWNDALDTLAHVYRDLGRLDEAIATQREALQLPDSLSVGSYEHFLMELYEEKGDLAGAEEALLELLGRRQVARSADDPILGSSYRRLGRVRAGMGRLEEAEADLRRAVAQFEKTLAADHLWVWRARSELGAVLTERGKFEEAEEILIAAAQTSKPFGFFEIDAKMRAAAFARVVELYEVWEKPAEAAAWREQAEAYPAW